MVISDADRLAATGNRRLPHEAIPDQDDRFKCVSPLLRNGKRDAPTTVPAKQSMPALRGLTVEPSMTDVDPNGCLTRRPMGGRLCGEVERQAALSIYDPFAPWGNSAVPRYFQSGWSETTALRQTGPLYKHGRSQIHTGDGRFTN